MSNEKVVYRIYHPKGWVVRTYSTNKQAKAFIEGINFNIPSWHYDELYKMRAEIANIEEILYA